MEQQTLTPRQEMLKRTAPYQAYTYYLSTPILMVVTVLINIFTQNNSLSILIFLFTILGHLAAAKTTLSKQKYVAPILYYAAVAVVFLGMIIAIASTTNTNDRVLILGLTGVIALPIEIVAAVFFFLTAYKLKKTYPDMRNEAGEARQAYRQSKRQR